MAGARKTSRERAGCLTCQHHSKRPVMPTAPGTVSRRHSGILVLAAAAEWSSLTSSNPGARRDLTPRFQIRSTAHDRHRPLTTLQCCSQLSLVVDRQRACSADDRSRAPAHSRGDAQLSDHPYARIAEEYLAEHGGQPVNLNLELSREEYEDMIAPFIEETLGAIHIA